MSFWIIFGLIILGLDIFILLLPFLLKLRGVTLILRTKFGPAMIFDSKDDDGRPIRLLNVNGKFQSVSYLDEQKWADLACIYHEYFAQIQDIVGPADKMLILGGGGFSYPKFIGKNYPKTELTVVEIDPKIIKLAKKYFGLDRLLELKREAPLHVVCADGWQYLQDLSEPQDVIVNDAFGGKKPLGPLKTDQGAQLVFEKLTADGIYLANVISALEGPKAKIFEESKAACLACFEAVYLIPEFDDPTVLGNNVLIAAKKKLPIQESYRLH